MRPLKSNSSLASGCKQSAAQGEGSRKRKFASSSGSQRIMGFAPRGCITVHQKSDSEISQCVPWLPIPWHCSTAGAGLVCRGWVSLCVIPCVTIKTSSLICFYIKSNWMYLPQQWQHEWLMSSCLVFWLSVRVAVYNGRIIFILQALLAVCTHVLCCKATLICLCVCISNYECVYVLCLSWVPSLWIRADHLSERPTGAFSNLTVNLPSGHSDRRLTVTPTQYPSALRPRLKQSHDHISPQARKTNKLVTRKHCAASEGLFTVWINTSPGRSNIFMYSMFDLYYLSLKERVGVETERTFSLGTLDIISNWIFTGNTVMIKKTSTAQQEPISHGSLFQFSPLFQSILIRSLQQETQA